MTPETKDGKVVLSVVETVAIAHWIERVKEYSLAVRACPSVMTDRFTTDDETAVTDVLPEILVSGVNVSVAWIHCGRVNAYYLDGDVIMCDDVLESGLGRNAARFFLAHEVGHAVVDQLELPVLGNEEIAADEYAAVTLLVTGHWDDVMNAAIWLAEHTQRLNLRDEHPNNAVRAWDIACLADGSAVDSVDESCRARWKHTARTWAKLLLPHEEG